MLDPLNRRSENVGVMPIIVAELKLRDVQRQVLFAHVVERTDHAAFEDAPKALNRVGMNCTHDVITARMVDSDVLRKFLIQMLVAGPLVRNQRA